MSGQIRKQTIVCLACFGMIVPQASLANETRSAADDVRLGHGGTLKGSVVDRQGRPIANAPVSIQFNGITVAQARSNASGRFAVTGLRGGMHSVVTTTASQPTRLWSQKSAPPSAKSAVAVRPGTIVRGQDDMYFDASGALVGGIAVAGAIIGIAAWTDSKSGGPTSP